MLIQNDFTTTVQLDPIEWFDVEWNDHGNEYHRARVTQIKRTVYPAQGGGHGWVVFGIGLPYLKSGELGKRQETVHRLDELIEQIPPKLSLALVDSGIFEPVED